MPAVADPPAQVVMPSAPVKSAEEVAAAAAQVQVDATKIGANPDPTTQPAKPGSGRAKLSEKLREKFGGQAAPAAPADETPPASTKPGATKPSEKVHAEDPEGVSHTPPPGSKTPAAAAAPDATKGKDGKVSPWKLMDQFKDRASKAEARVLELEKHVGSPEKVKERDERFSAMEKENKEMREELRYFNAEKFDPDVAKAEADYQGSWKRALSELKEIQVKDETGNVRALVPDDLLTLVNLPLAEAADVADKAFGRFAPEVMAYRKEIKALFEAKQAKMEDLKKTGATRETQRAEAHKRQVEEMAKFTTETYTAAVQEGMADKKFGQYFQEKEGDEEWNTRLGKAVKFVDDALRANSHDPKLTADQRKLAIQKHAALRNRAVGWSMVRFENAQLQKELAEAKEELSKYKSTTPAAGGRTSASGAPALSGMAGLHAKLRTMVKVK